MNKELQSRSFGMCIGSTSMRLDLLAPHDAVKPRHPVSKRGPSSAIICTTTILTVEALALSEQIASSEYSNQTVPLET
jgi:hypothetical protein